MVRQLHVRARWLTGAAAGLAVAITNWMGLFSPLEDLFVDARLRFRKPQPASDEVRLVGFVIGMWARRWVDGRFHGQCIGMCGASLPRWRRCRPRR